MRPARCGERQDRQADLGTFARQGVRKLVALFRLAPPIKEHRVSACRMAVEVIKRRQILADMDEPEAQALKLLVDLALSAAGRIDHDEAKRASAAAASCFRRVASE